MKTNCEKFLDKAAAIPDVLFETDRMFLKGEWKDSDTVAREFNINQFFVRKILLILSSITRPCSFIMELIAMDNDMDDFYQGEILTIDRSGLIVALRTVEGEIGKTIIIGVEELQEMIENNNFNEEK